MKALLFPFLPLKSSPFPEASRAATHKEADRQAPLHLSSSALSSCISSFSVLSVFKMADGKRILGKTTSWLGLFCGVFTLVVWAFLLKALSPRIKVDSSDPLDDINKGYWRMAMFTFAPSVFFDIWTPFVMGFVSILCHFPQYSLSWMCRSYIHFFAWNFALALFGNIGYSGGVGIICSAFTFLCTLLSLICIFVLPDQSPRLELKLPSKLSGR
ncbi:hypothetical protein Efla_007243 [Eimeria flavescens]